MKNTEEVWSLIDAKERSFTQLSDRVWGMPKLCHGEFRSCAEHTAMLEWQGFRVTKDVAGIPTAVVGEAGDGGPVIAILGEYDALPGLSQEAGVAEPRPLPGRALALTPLRPRTNMDSVGKISLHLRPWIAALAATAFNIGTWSIAPAPANAGVVIGVDIPFPGLYVQYPYYPYPPPAYYPYYPPPAQTYSPAPSYTPQPTYAPQAGRSRGNIARQLNQQELNRLQAPPVNPPPPPYYPPPPRY